MKYLESVFNLKQEFIYKNEIIMLFSKIGNPVINSTKVNLYKLFSLHKDEKELTNLVFEQDVELFIKEKVILLLDFSGINKIYLFFIYNNSEELKIFEAYKKVIEKFLSSKGIEFEFENLKTEIKLFNPHAELTINEDLMNYISLLNTHNYLILKRIRELGTTFFRSDLLRLLGVSNEELEDLVNNEFLSNEFVFICKETGRQIIQASNLDILEHSKGIKCFHCGKSLKEERMEEVLTLTEKADYILSNNTAFPEYIYKKLREELGENIYLDIAEVSTNLVYTELSKPIVISFLKDDFKIHNVFFLDIYYSSYKPYGVILVSINKSLKVLEDYFNNKGIKAVLIDELKDLVNTIKQELDFLIREYVLSKLDSYSSYFNFKLSEVFNEAKIKRELSVIQE